MIVIYENLTNKLHQQHLYDILNFLNFTVDLSRIECTIKHSEGKFHRKEKCIKKKFPDRENEDYFISDEQNNNTTNDIFTDDHKHKINMAIENVNELLVKRGFTLLPINEYKSTKIKLKLCP